MAPLEISLLNVTIGSRIFLKFSQPQGTEVGKWGHGGLSVDPPPHKICPDNDKNDKILLREIRLQLSLGLDIQRPLP